RCLIAEAETGTPQPAAGGDGVVVPARRVILRAGALLERRADGVRSARATGDVVADVHDTGRARDRGQEGVEGDDAVGFGGWDGETLADVIEGPFADPPHP